MRIKKNITAMNANRMLNLVTNVQAESTEKLSSGYRINRASDDAAGLSISEKMRRQIRGLTQASANAEDGISCVQTAEGALNEVQDMLQRMNELAVKGENGTLTTTDRAYIQSEVRQLMNEVDRVQSTTTFNEMNLLDGSFIKGLQVGAEAGQHIDISIANMSMAGLAAGVNSRLYTPVDYNYLKEYWKFYTWVTDSYELLPGQTFDPTKLDLSDTNMWKMTSTISDGYRYKLWCVDPEHPWRDLGDWYGASVAVRHDGKTDYYSYIGKKKYDGKNRDMNDATNWQQVQVDVESWAEHDHFSPIDEWRGTYAFRRMTTGLANKVLATFMRMETGNEGTVATAREFNSLNAFVKAAISLVSQQRSDLGAIQNRLEHTVRNLENIVENTTASESEIRDADIATEMVRFSNNSILQQAGVSMLSQANQNSQMALTLLGGA